MIATKPIDKSLDIEGKF